MWCQKIKNLMKSTKRGRNVTVELSSSAKFIELVEVFGDCSGLKTNPEKTEVLLLGNEIIRK